MQILIPMAGEGSRFAKEGYTFPKPLIDVEGKPMIQRVVENLDFDATYIFLVRKEHLDKYSGLKSTLDRITNGRFKIVEVDGLTEGAACTALLAKDHIDTDDDALLIANSDQFIEYSPGELPRHSRNCSDCWMLLVFCVRGGASEVVVCQDQLSRSDHGDCREEPDLRHRNLWHLLVSPWRDFVKAAERMIKNDIRVNNEFYIAPVYNELMVGVGL
jgi:dTDP-glucose pyrophosphorylase